MANMSISEAAQRQASVTTSTAQISADEGYRKDSLPPIVNLDYEKYRLEAPDSNTGHVLPGMHKFTSGMNSEPYTAPPPPYSLAGTTPQSVPGTKASPEARRWPPKDENESPKLAHSLPSLSEALKSADAVSPVQNFANPAVQSTQSFADAPRGPGNPFSQPLISTARGSLSSPHDTASIHTLPPPPLPPEARTSSLSKTPSLLQQHSSTSSHFASTFPYGSTLIDPPPPQRSSFSAASPRQGYPFPDPAPVEPPPISTKRIEQKPKHESEKRSHKHESRNYNETIKRHFEVWDAELALKDVSQAVGPFRIMLIII